MLANKKNKQMGYSKPQKTLVNHDKEEIKTEPAAKKLRQSDIRNSNSINDELQADTQILNTGDVIECSTGDIVTKPIKQKINYCQYCHKQFSTYSSLNQHNKSIAHLNAFKGCKAKLKVSEKDWLCDAVSFFNHLLEI